MDDQQPRRFKLDELAERAGVSPRTVRYYVQRGLLPAPEFRGPDTAYDEQHLHRLQAIRVLQERHLPLDAIETSLAGLTPAELARLAKGKLPAPVDVTPVVSRSPAPAVTVDRVTRHALAPGLELLVSDHASPEVRALAERLLREAAHPSKKRTP